MKSKLNITIEAGLLSSMKAYAIKHETSISELVKRYFKSLTRPAKRNSIINMVEKLEPPAIDVNADLKNLFYEEQVRNIE